jgi:hypothetical protein
MKKLALTAVLAAVVSQAAGCIITSSDDTNNVDPVITANISLSNAGPNPLVCVNDRQDPRGQDGLRINARLQGSQGAGVSDIYNCTVTSVQTRPLPTGPGVYDVWVDYFTDRGFPDDPSQWVVVDATDPVPVDATNSDIAIDADLAIGYGFFNPIWTLPAGVTQQQCDTGSVDIVSTITGTSTAFDDVFDCTAGFNDPNGTYTSPLPLDDYTIAASLADANDNELGTAIGNGSVVDGNSYVEMNIGFQ